MMMIKKVSLMGLIKKVSLMRLISSYRYYPPNVLTSHSRYQVQEMGMRIALLIKSSNWYYLMSSSCVRVPGKGMNGFICTCWDCVHSLFKVWRRFLINGSSSCKGNFLASLLISVFRKYRKSNSFQPFLFRNSFFLHSPKSVMALSNL